MRGNVLHQSMARGRCGCAIRYLSRARDQARGTRHGGRAAVGLGHGLWPTCRTGGRRGTDTASSAAGAASGTTGSEIVMRALLALIVLSFALAACGERPQVLEYKQGSYQGKHDTHAWD